jgi:hypothetical protein
MCLYFRKLYEYSVCPGKNLHVGDLALALLNHRIDVLQVLRIINVMRMMLIVIG